MTLEEFNNFIDESYKALGSISVGYMQANHETDLLKQDITFTFSPRVNYSNNTIGLYRGILWFRDQSLPRKAPTETEPALFTIKAVSAYSEDIFYTAEYPSNFKYYP